MKKQNLKKFLLNRDCLTLAAKLGVTTATIYNWRAGRAVPTPAVAKKLIMVSGGQLDYNSIYRG